MFPMRPNAYRAVFVSAALIAFIGCAETVEPLSANPSVEIKGIQITPSTSNLAVPQSTQLRAIASYADGTTLDVTSTAKWASSQTAVVPSAPLGLPTCETAGTTQISASTGNVVAAITMTCSAPQIEDVKLEAIPLVIRSAAPFQYHLLADYSNGTTIDVTASTVWTTDPLTANVNTDGLLNCNHPGTAMIVATFSGMSTQAPFTCVLHSITSEPGFTESAATFDGPFASWLNVKAVFGAKGDGVTDDTAALQAALNSIAQSHYVLWIPNGNYLISKPLTITGVSNVTILGEDPRTTTILWGGPQGGTMLTLAGCNGINIGRLTLDGQSTSGVDLMLTWNSVGYYPTRNLIHDSRMINTETGLQGGFVGETEVERVHFDHNTQAGVSLGNWNTLNWNIVDCLFTDDALGVTNGYGAGSFTVTNSVFVRSTTADMSIGNTGSFSMRSNLSVDSKMFFQTGETGAPANIIIQGNTIYNPGSSPIETGTPGSLMILDNQFLDLDTSYNILYSRCFTPVNFISVGNIYSVAIPFVGNIGHYTSVDDDSGVVDATLPWTVPTEVYIPPLSHRQVFDVTPGAYSDALQTAINAAVSVAGIVHLPAGNYAVNQTLQIPANANIAILGDGSISDLVALPTLQGPTLSSYATTLQMDDFRFSSYSTSPTNAQIDLHVPDTPSTYIFCDGCTIDDQITTGFEWDGLDDATMEFKVLGLNGTVSANIHGGVGRQNGNQTLGNISEFMATSGDHQVDLGGHLLHEDGFHDVGQGSIQFELTGDGSVTQQGGAIGANAVPTMTVNNYKGQLSLLGVGTNSYVNITGDAPSSVFVAGVVQESGVSPFLDSDSSATVIGISNSSTPNNGTPTPLPDTPTTPSIIEHMMSMARTQILVPRKPIQFKSTTVKMTRLLVEFNGVGIRVENDTPAGTNGSYSITSVGGSSLPQASCGSGEMTMTGAWTLQDGGDGFFGLSQNGTVLSEDVIAENGGDALRSSGTMLSARDRWRFMQIGDGSVKVVNRATGDLLTQDGGGCAYAAQENETANQHWLLAVSGN
jgi:Pectate lyase superfamily protein